MVTKAEAEAIKKKLWDAQARVLVENLRERQFSAEYVDTAEQAVEKALSYMPPKSSVSWGGSVTIDEIGLLDRVRAGPYKVIDRAEASTPEERDELIRKAFDVDFYLTSFNGVAMDGTIFNIDGTGNRVAAITYGPRNVIAVVGMNKVCRDREGALIRAQDRAAATNAARFGMEETLYTERDVTDDTLVTNSICNFTEQITFCPKKGRIKVILVGEDLGF